MEKASEMEKQGINVFHTEVGEPGFDVPACVSKAVGEAFKEGHTHYTHSLGDSDLRLAISKRYLQEYNVTVSPEQIIVRSGSSPAILLALGVLCDPGDEII